MIEEQLKLAKRQNYETRYEYLCGEINAIDYAIKLEKYTLKLLKEKQELIDYLKEQINYIKNNFSQVNGNYFMLNDKLETYEEILSKIEKSDK